MKKVISATANDDYSLTLEFNDGSIKCFDVKPYLDKGIFRELRNLDYFKDIKIAFGTVRWRNEQDFAPETLYSEGVFIANRELIEV
jgi:hypothetical protein